MTALQMHRINATWCIDYPRMHRELDNYQLLLRIGAYYLWAIEYLCLGARRFDLVDTTDQIPIACTDPNKPSGEAHQVE
jgi:hypothetical protein